MVSAENRRLKEQIEAQGHDIAAMKAGAAKLKAFTDKAVDREREAKEAAITEAEALRAKAIDDSDGAAAVAAERDIRALEKELDDIPVAEARDPAVDAWIAENPWYGADAEARAVADGLSIHLKQERP